MDPKSCVSQRGQDVIPPRFLLAEAMTRCFENPYSADNPSGIINCGTAENFLCFDQWEKALGTKGVIACLDDTTYSFPHGTARVRELIAKEVLGRFINTEVDPNDIGIMTGCTAILEAVFYAICSEGDGVLIPAPYYGAFDVDLTARSKCKILSVPCNTDNDFEITVDSLESTMEQARNQGVNVRALLLTNPVNPTGRVYGEKLMKSILDFVVKHEGIQLIMDDIFALSNYTNAPYTHPYKIIEKQAPEYTNSLVSRIHCTYSMAKDFGISGWKIGVFYSKNQYVLASLQTLSVFSTVSRLATASIEHSLSQNGWVDQFVKHNNERLKIASQCVCRVFDKCNVQYTNPEAGLFVWFDLSPWLEKRGDFDSEMAIYESLMDAGVYVNPGVSFGSLEAGWFRMIFSIREAYLPVALDRLEKWLSKNKQ